MTPTRALALAFFLGTAAVLASCSGNAGEGTPSPTAATSPAGSPATSPSVPPTPRPVTSPATVVPPGRCRVAAVEDGDTIEVADCAEAGRVRLLLVDAPETGSDCYADEARSFLREHLLGRAVRLEADARDKDQYERRLRYVWLGDELVNETLVREGFARVAVYESTAQLERLTSAEIAAKGASRGLWGACISGNCDGPVVITSLDKRAETVTVEASGVDLTGWSIHSEKGSASGQRYAFPRGFVLTGSVTVVSGVARFEAAPGRLWWTKEQVWNNNDDDDAQLFNAANKLVCEFDDGQ